MKHIDVMWDLARIIIEVVSTTACFIFVWFLIKPYWFTREDRYLGLPLGFGFLGVSYVISALAYSKSFWFKELLWLQLLTRTFAFVFLAITYYFSTKPAKNTRPLWDITFSLLIVALIAFIILVFIAPQVASGEYTASQLHVRTFNVICLVYVAIHTLRNHMREPSPATLWIPLGFILLGISQYSLLFWYIDSSCTAFWGAIGIRLAALAVFLFVAYKTFYSKKEEKEP
jgi:hypothetical protein